MANKRRTAKNPDLPFIGHWDIIETQDLDDLALAAGPAEISFEARGNDGHFSVCGIEAQIDWRLADERTVEFTFEGNDEEEVIFGRGRGWLDDGGHLLITIWIHKGDSMSLVAERNG